MASHFEGVMVRIEDALFTVQDKNVVYVKMLVIDSETENEVEFEFNLLEETVSTVAAELISEMRLPNHVHEYIANKIREEVDRVKNQRDMISLHFLMEQLTPSEFFCKKLVNTTDYEKTMHLYTQIADLLFQSNALKPSSRLLTRDDLFILAPICFKLGHLKEAKIFYKKYLDFKLEDEIPFPSTTTQSSNVVNENHRTLSRSSSFLSNTTASQHSLSRSSSFMSNGSGLDTVSEGNSPEELYAMIGLSRVYCKQKKWDRGEALLKSVLILCTARRYGEEDHNESSHSEHTTPVHSPPMTPLSVPISTYKLNESSSNHGSLQPSPRSSNRGSTEKLVTASKGSTEQVTKQKRIVVDEVFARLCLSWESLEIESRKQLVKVYEAQGKIAEAEMIYKRMFEDINSTVKSRDRKAERMINEGKFVEAQTLLKDVYKLKEAALPILETLAELYLKHNKLTESLQCLHECLETREKLNDPEHFSIAETLNRIAQLHKQSNKPKEAEETLQRALKICEKALNTNENAIKFYQTRPKEEQEANMNGVTQKNQEIRKLLLLTLSNFMIILNEQGRTEDVTNFKKRLSEVAVGLETSNNKSVS